MATTSTLLTSLKAYSGKPNDDTYLKAAIVSALREVRNIRAPWSEGTFRFYTEANTSEYATGYPGIPADLLQFDSVMASTSNVSGAAVIQPDTIITKTNLTEGASDAVTLAWILDRPHDPDPSANHLWTPTAAGDPIDWKVEFATPTKTLPEGADRQKLRLLMRYKNSASTPTITLIDESSGSTTVLTQTPTLTATATVYEYTWDARTLDVNPPTDLNLRIQLTPSGTENVELLAVEWITDYEYQDSARPIPFYTIDEMQEQLGAYGRTSTGIPQGWTWHHDSMILAPEPSGVYEIYGTYMKDATRDSDGNEITTSFAGTETNDWLDRGLHVVEAKALEIYYMHRAQNPDAAQMARMQFLDSVKTIRRETIAKAFRGPSRGYL